ncbi:asparagine synthase-related protein [Pseudomonas silvicola]|nr:asparagine synthase-related protein [Pseudomonas silvicola]
MRLICGFTHMNGQAAEAERLERMIQAMIEPGLSPHIARHLDGPTALAMLDFSQVAGELPQGADGLVLAADAQIHEPRGDSEALLLAALQTQRPEAVGQLIGDFGAAAWHPGSGSLICVRDAMGVRPFFFIHQPGECFAFASLPRGLHAAAFIPRALDHDYLLAELAGHGLGPERSLFQGIERLAPGQWLRVSPQGVERRWHWRLDRTEGGRHRGTPQQAAAQLATLVTEAVRCRLPATGDAAAHLSGGLDSSSLAIIAARLLGETQRSLRGYSFLPSYIEGVRLEGEGPYVDAALGQAPNILSQPIRITDAAAYILPQMDPDQLVPCDPAFPEMQVCADTARHGITTILSGWGGDEGPTFNGRGALAEAFLHGRWRYLAGEFKALARVRGMNTLAILRAELLPYLLPERFYRWWEHWGKGTPYARHRAAKQPLLKAGRGIGQPSGALTASALENRWQLLNAHHLAKRCEHWALLGARHGVAFAYPLRDRRVVEFAWSLPSTMFLRGGWKRRVFRDAMAAVLPAQIRWRHTKLTPFPEALWLQTLQREALQRHMAEIADHAQAAALFDLDAIAQRIASLPPAEQAARLALAEENSRMASAGAGVPLSILHATVYLKQHP